MKGVLTVKKLWLTAVLAPLLGMSATSFACPACRDITAGSAPQMQSGIRKGILVLGIPAGAVFLGILALAWRMKPKEEDLTSSEDDYESTSARK